MNQGDNRALWAAVLEKVWCIVDGDDSLIGVLAPKGGP